MITLSNLTVHYGDRQVLHDINLTIPRGSTCAIIGPTGCGKSTLLYAMAGLMAPKHGAITMDGVTIHQPRSATSLILQDYGLFPWLTTERNILMAAQLKRIPPATARQKTDLLLAELGLQSVARSYPSQLSGGQRQRVAIARALVTDPDLLLMDEPFSALDALTREKMQSMIRDIGRQRGLTTVLVTHSIDEAVYLGDQVVVLTQSPAVIADQVANPCPLAPDPRLHPEFGKLCGRLRLLLRGEQDA